MLLTALLACAPKPSLTAPAPPDPPKNVILVLGDGMGPQQVGLLELWARLAPGRPEGAAPTAFTTLANLGYTGLSMHYPDRYLVTDSACSATQLATGRPAPVQAIGVDGMGVAVPTVLEMARDRGLATGLVSDTRITHATPASFAAHVASRDDEATIAEQLVASNTDVMLSGGWRTFVPQDEPGSTRTDDRDLLAEAASAGYAVVRDRQALTEAGPKVLGLFAPSSMLDAITDRSTRADPDRTEPSLVEMTVAALDRLSADEDGFFLMIESGQIDWAGHANDAGWLLQEMIRADEMLREVIDFVSADGETLLLVTADHETGAFGVGYRRGDRVAPETIPGGVFAETPFAPTTNFGDRALLDALAAQRAPLYAILGQAAANGRPTPASLATTITQGTGFAIDEAAAARILATHDDPLGEAERPIPAVQDFAAFYPAGPRALTALVARELATSQNVVWGTGGHTHTPVPVFAVGPTAASFARLSHHTDIGESLVAWAQGH